MNSLSQPYINNVYLLAPCEYSSGERQRRGAITETGNQPAHISMTTVVILAPLPHPITLVTQSSQFIQDRVRLSC